MLRCRFVNDLTHAATSCVEDVVEFVFKQLRCFGHSTTNDMIAFLLLALFEYYNQTGIKTTHVVEILPNFFSHELGAVD